MVMAATQLKYDEWCPNCGEGVDAQDINPFTGFCITCTPVDVSAGEVLCEICGNRFIVGNRNRKQCDRCVNTNIAWLRRNADAIERVMVHYEVDAITAIQKVYDDNRPRCVMCGDEIKHGTKGRTRFCKKRDRCRRAAIRYHHYRKRKGMSDDAALERAIHGRKQT